MDKIIDSFDSFVAFALVFVFHIAAYVEQPNASPVVVMIDKGRSGFVLTVNSQRPARGLLWTLSNLHDQAPSSPSVLLVHETATLSMLNNVVGIMGKAGFVHLGILFFDRHKDWMAEIKILGGMPLSVTPSGSSGGEGAN